MTRGNQVGGLLALSALTQDGLAVLHDGTLVHAVELAALAPLRMSSEALEQAAGAVGELAARLPDRQALQLITCAEPLDTTILVDELRHRAQQTRRALEADQLAARGEALEALALSTADGLVEHCQRLVGMGLRHLLIAPWRPSGVRIRRRSLTTAGLGRAVEEHDAHLRSIVSHLAALDLGRRLLNGTELGQLLDRQLNPASGGQDVELSDLFGAPSPDREHAAEIALELRRRLCRTTVDQRARTHLIVGEVAVHCRAVSSVPDHTWLGWLLHLMQSPYPFTLSVRWQAGRRASERQRARQRYRRIWGVQRAREMRLRAPDPEANEREHEAAQLNAELTASAGAGVYDISITLALQHPEGNASELIRHANELERDLLARTDARLHLPSFAQLHAWRATWPLGVDPLGIARK